MFKSLFKKKLLVMPLIWLALLLSTATFADDGLQTFDIAEVNFGVVYVDYDVTTSEQYKVLVFHDDERMAYNYFGGPTAYPLQMGNGDYRIGLYQKLSGAQYQLVEDLSFEVNSSETTIFLQSTQNVDWSIEDQAVAMAAAVTAGASSDQEKVERIYEYIMAHVVYDYEKMSNVTTNYLPNPDETLASGKGICYDYASLFAVMLRSQSVPTKLVKGYRMEQGIYHAWNQVWIEGQWSTFDLTYGESMMSLGEANATYQIVHVY